MLDQDHGGGVEHELPASYRINTAEPGASRRRSRTLFGSVICPRGETTSGMERLGVLDGVADLVTGHAPA